MLLLCWSFPLIIEVDIVSQGRVRSFVPSSFWPWSQGEHSGKNYLGCSQWMFSGSGEEISPVVFHQFGTLQVTVLLVAPPTDNPWSLSISTMQFLLLHSLREVKENSLWLEDPTGKFHAMSSHLPTYQSYLSCLPTWLLITANRNPETFCSARTDPELQ